MTATESSIAIARTAARAASDKLAQDIVALDVSDRLAITDIFFIASAPSERQVNAIVDGIEEELIKANLRPVRREGRSEGRWVLLDYVEVVVHVQHEEDRVFYALERLWKDCPVVDLQLDGSDPSAKASHGSSAVSGSAASGSAASGQPSAGE
ncbi:MAG TPA: ribosome silencing factor [Micrococcaceae bacterium]|nr:ribosome silencing factor [Micrococcaceae bacterium]